MIITVFGSSHPSENHPDYSLAFEIGRKLASEGFITCNGGYGGIMEATARGAHECGGKTIGIITDQFGRSANPYIDEVIRVRTHIERLLKLVEMGDAYIVLRGLTGTLAELAITWEYIAKDFIRRKPLVLIGDFWESLVETVGAEFRREGLARMAELPILVKDADECIEILKKLKK